MEPSATTSTRPMRADSISVHEDHPRQLPCQSPRFTAAQLSRPQCTSRAMTETTNNDRYKNNLLAAIGFLDLTNALDFPANVWNEVPPPFFAQILMGVGGSICAVCTLFAAWDLIRARANIRFLRRERAYLQDRRRTHGSSLLEDAWLDMNVRELGWELIDRALLDVFMFISGLLVGAGTIMAIRGEIPAVYKASNLLSGYVGNAFLATYAIINVAWSSFMWSRAHKHDMAIRRVQGRLDPAIVKRLTMLSAKHKLYALLTGLTMVVSGVGSMISATLWPGYVVLIPCIFGSVFCNLYWRYWVNYSRLDIRQRSETDGADILAHLRVIADISAIPRSKTSREGNDMLACSNIVEMSSLPVVLRVLFNLSLAPTYTAYLQAESTADLAETTMSEHDSRLDTAESASTLQPDHGASQRAVCRLIRGVQRRSVYEEESFLAELYGCYLIALERVDSCQSQLSDLETQVDQETTDEVKREKGPVQSESDVASIQPSMLSLDQAG